MKDSTTGSKTEAKHLRSQEVTGGRAVGTGAAVAVAEAAGGEGADLTVVDNSMEPNLENNKVDLIQNSDTVLQDLKHLIPDKKATQVRTA